MKIFTSHYFLPLLQVSEVDIYRSDLRDKALANYVWHHLDKMEIINGEPWCTMQLVRQDVHMKAGPPHWRRT
ncbi:MAG: HNH endonuclease [Hydrotalea flava]|nr:HNH endonuclease [Hydrotalea flava]